MHPTARERERGRDMPSAIYFARFSPYTGPKELWAEEGETKTIGTYCILNLLISFSECNTFLRLVKNYL